MKILRLDIEGFGPFRDRQLLDFQLASTNGLLLISGRTGSGKSSLLDTVSFALYGAVPRYDGQVSRVRSDHSRADQPTLVRLDFEMSGARFRVERSPEYERPAKRGGGTTTQKTEARLWQWDDEAAEWIGVASRPVDVAAFLASVLRLNHQQFLQVVMLSQGGFQRFLKAADEERQATLRTLFQTERFSEIEKALTERRSALDAELRESEARVDGLLGGLEETLARQLAGAAPAGAEPAGAELGRGDTRPPVSAPTSVAARLAAASELVKESEKLADALHTDSEAARETAASSDAKLQQATSHSEKLARIRRIEARQLELAAERKNMDVLRGQLEAAARAAAVESQRLRLAASEADEALAEKNWRTQYTELTRLKAAMQSAQTQTQTQTQTHTQTQSQTQPRSDSNSGSDSGPISENHDSAFLRGGVLRNVHSSSSDTSDTDSGEGAAEEQWHLLSAALAEDRTAADLTLGALVEGEAQEQQLDDLEASVARTEQEILAYERQHDTEQRSLQKLPNTATELRAEREGAAAEAALTDQLQASADAAAARLEAASRVELLSQELREAEAKTAKSAAAAAERAAEVSKLFTRRIAGMAGELAAQLEPGRPCQVCGATEHPAPAQHSDQVTPETIAAAEARQRAAQTALESVRAAERETLAQLSEVQAAAGGKNREDAAAEVEETMERLARARESVARLYELDEQLRALEAETRERTERMTELSTALAVARNRVQAESAQLEGIESAVEKARSGYSTVTERRETLQQLRGVLDRTLECGLARNTAQETRQRESNEFIAALIAQEFLAPTDSDDPAAVSEAAAAARSSLMGDDTVAAERERLAEYDAAVQQNTGELASPDLQNLDRTPIDLLPLQTASTEHRAKAEEALAAHAAAAKIAGENRSTLNRTELIVRDTQTSSEELLQLRTLTDAVQGKEPNTMRMRLEVFVLAARLEAIVTAANQRLARMVGGRYRLEHDDARRARGRQSGLGLAVIDEYTGRARSTDSLSGGESFLASLALALGLADVVTAESGGLELDTLFIDEGFGSLDPDALDQALAILDGLRAGGRTVALISHVAELKERLTGGLEVVVDGRGTSTIQGAGVLDPAQN